MLTTCGSSRQLQRRNYTPDQATHSLDTEWQEQQALSATTVVTAPTPVADPLVRQLDSLLLSADTLMQISQLGMQIVDLTAGKVLYSHLANQRMRPASTEKVVTAIAALDLLGPSYQFSTSALTTGTINSGTLHGDLYIKGAMDPLFNQSDARILAQRIKNLGIHTIDGRLLADASLKDSDEFGWGWCWDDDNPPLSPLLISGKPGLLIAMNRALRNAGVTIKKGMASGSAPSTARELTAFRRPITEVLQPMMKESDNLCAEAVFYQIQDSVMAYTKHIQTKKHNSRNRIAPAVNRLIERANLLATLTLKDSTTTSVAPFVQEATYKECVVADGSGLSLYNYQTPRTFTHLLTYAASRPDSILHPLMDALPIAAVDGTLEKRMIATKAAANVRAKTGSVTAVSTLVGYTTQRSTGHLMAFAIMCQGLPRLALGRELQDQICIILSD